jgi:hypothetical protein
MFKLTRLITFRADAAEPDREALAERLRAVAAASPEVLRSYLAPTQAGNLNGGDLIWHVQFADEAACRRTLAGADWRDADHALASDPVAHVDGVGYRQELLHIGAPAFPGGIHRTLLIAVRPGTAAAKIAAFEAEMREMAHYLPCIRNWGFSRVATSVGARRWTHVWEQDFDDVGALFGPYMNHPIHFAHIDRWYDTQSHDFIVDTHIGHTFCAVQGSMLAPTT